MDAIVLNNDYSYINIVSMQKAFRLIEKGKVVVEKWSDRVIKTVSREFTVPMVLRLKKFINVLYKRKIHWKNSNVFIRDDFTCVYCGKQNLNGMDLTIDHVIPKSKGGKNTYENTVTACRGCNNYKGNKTLQEAGMFFYKSGYKPHHPNFMEFIAKKEKQNIDKLNSLFNNI